ncbi:MAG: hypothetical protein AVDCRST_MAG45-1541, partial [uncultured Solirubrobacterales bacterium]
MAVAPSRREADPDSATQGRIRGSEARPTRTAPITADPAPL